MGASISNVIELKNLNVNCDDENIHDVLRDSVSPKEKMARPVPNCAISTMNKALMSNKGNELGAHQATTVNNGANINRNHDPSEFRLNCNCGDCLNYRERLIHVVVEDHYYNTVWDQLKTLIREFFDNLLQNSVPCVTPPHVKYESLMQKDGRWFSNGDHIATWTSKEVQFEFSDASTLTKRQKTSRLIDILHRRDPHQLAELLLIQMRSIAIAYGDYVKKLITTDENGKNPKYDPVQLINAIINGYDQFGAKDLSREIGRPIDNQVPYSLRSWTELNSRMYQRWVYLDVIDLIPECIKLAKDILQPENYLKMARRVVHIDTHMHSITAVWQKDWNHFQNFNMAAEECTLRKRSSHLEKMLKMIRICNLRCDVVKEVIPMKQWATLENRQEAWLQMIDYLMKVWNPSDGSRLTAKMLSETCVKSELETKAHYIDCECVACHLIGGPKPRPGIAKYNEFLWKLKDENNELDEYIEFAKAQRIARKRYVATNPANMEFKSGMGEKAAKRARQKQNKKLRELAHVLNELQFAMVRYDFKIAKVSDELKSLKIAKAIDEKRIDELEEIIKRLKSSKAEIESAYNVRYTDLYRED